MEIEMKMKTEINVTPSSFSEWIDNSFFSCIELSHLFFRWMKTVSLSFSFLSDIYTFLCSYVYYVSRALFGYLLPLFSPAFPSTKAWRSLPLLAIIFQLSNESAQCVAVKWKSLPFIGATQRQRPQGSLDPFYLFMCAYSNAANCMRVARISWILVAVNDRPLWVCFSTFPGRDYLLICITARHSQFAVLGSQFSVPYSLFTFFTPRWGINCCRASRR